MPLCTVPISFFNCAMMWDVKKIGSTVPTITANSVSGIPSAANIENPTQTGLKRKENLLACLI